MKIRTTKIGGIRYIFVTGPQSFVNDAVWTLKQANKGDKIECRMSKLGFCDVRGVNVYRCIMQIEVQYVRQAG